MEIPAKSRCYAVDYYNYYAINPTKFYVNGLWEQYFDFNDVAMYSFRLIVGKIEDLSMLHYSV